MQRFVSAALSERRVRTAMSYLYTTMVLSEHNTDHILNGSITDSDAAEPAGNPIAASCMNGLTWWLRTLEMAAEPRPFKDEILFPLRKSAGFLQYLRGRSPRSITVAGMVFVVSEPYPDPVTGRDERTVCLVAPGLESTMHIRISEWGDGDVPGWYRFDGVQPIPVANRMRPTQTTTIQPINSRMGLSQMGFLYCSLSEAHLFERSVAMENLCQIPGRQVEREHILGAPLILHGRISGIDRYRINLEGCGNNGGSLSAYLSSGAAETLRAEQIDEMVGKYARVLAVVWYRGDADTGPVPEFEAYAIELATKEDAVAGDVAGLARVMGGVPVKDVRDRYGVVPKSPLLGQEDGTVVFRRANTVGLNREFVVAVDAIRAARQNESRSIFCFPESVFHDSVTDGQITATLGNGLARNILLRVIQDEEYGHRASKNTLRNDFQDADFDYRIWRLRKLDLVAEAGGILTATHLGRKHGYACVAEDIGLRE